jgi:hypothetical protein
MHLCFSMNLMENPKIFIELRLYFDLPMDEKYDDSDDNIGKPE